MINHQKNKAASLRSVSALTASGLVRQADKAALEDVASRYAIALTPTVLDAINHADPADPLARQFVPSVEELTTLPQENADPIGDNVHSPVEGVVHRYPDRVLLKIVHTCPVYCRFCFRREMVGHSGASLIGDKLDAAFAYIANNPSIWEVIMTGGDPLVLSARRIAAMTQRLADIPHVKVIRWHSRVPVVDPQRIAGALVRALTCKGKAVYVAIHANHAQEFSPSAIKAVALLADSGLSLVSQTVLLKGVNDTVHALSDLMRCFVENRIKPYYLHHPDLAPGTSHFRLSIAEGRALVEALRGTLSGLCQPTYVLDIPGGHGKVPLGVSPVTEKDGVQVAQDRHGKHHQLF